MKNFLKIELDATWYQFALILVLALLLIQIISRLTKKKNSEEQAVLNEWHDDPANWKLGFLYYNKKDHRLLPPKRIPGLGWTINFANPSSISLMIVLIIIILIIVQFIS